MEAGRASSPLLTSSSTPLTDFLTVEPTLTLVTMLSVMADSEVDVHERLRLSVDGEGELDPGA